MSIVSNNIKYLRRLNGLTQEQFARKIGIKRSLLGAYEEARANPNLTNLKNMAHSFGVTVDNLLKNDLRKLRETPDLGLPFNPASLSPVSPLMREATPTAPQPLSAVIARFQPPRPTLRLVARPITLKPVRQEKYVQQPAPAQAAEKVETMRFNNHYDEVKSGPIQPQMEPAPPQQTIQLVRSNQLDEYLKNYQNTTFLQQLPVFRLPTLPSGHYRAFEAGEDFIYPGALLIGTFTKNWYEIKDGSRYILVTKQLGVITRISYNQVKNKGVLFLKSDQENIQDTEIAIRDVLEVWEVKAFISLTLPPFTTSLTKLKSILSDLRDELNQSDISNDFLA